MIFLFTLIWAQLRTSYINECFYNTVARQLKALAGFAKKYELVTITKILKSQKKRKRKEVDGLSQM